MCVLRPIGDRIIAIIRVPCRFGRYLVSSRSNIHDKEHPNWGRMPERCKINSWGTRLLEVLHLKIGTSADQKAESCGSKILTRKVWEGQVCRFAGERAFERRGMYVQRYTMPQTAIGEKWLRAS